MQAAHGSFNYLLVFLSYIISVCGAFTALVLARESMKVSKQERVPWVAWSAVIMGGIGIWSMHFVGMMAYHMDNTVNYDIPLTVLSLGRRHCLRQVWVSRSWGSARAAFPPF